MTDKLKVQQLSEYKNFIVKNNCVMIPIPDFDMLIDLANKAATPTRGINGDFFASGHRYYIQNGLIIKDEMACGIGYD